TIYDPPHLLHVRGALTEADARAAALVGSRRCTAYGLKTAARLAAGLARAGGPGVGGLAPGSPGAGHRGGGGGGGGQRGGRGGRPEARGNTPDWPARSRRRELY